MKKKSLYKKIICIFAGILFLIIAILIFSPVLRMYLVFLISPKTYRDTYFCKLGKGEQEIYILGSPHEYLLTNNEYTLLHIDAVIKNLKPDLLLLESRPEELKIDNRADGPWPETLYGNLLAHSLNIPVDGVDYWSPEDGRPGSTYKKRDDKITENIVKESENYRKVLVLLGSDHVIKDVPRLQKEGYLTKNFSKKEKDELFTLREDKLVYPKDTEYYIEKRIQREKDQIGSFYKSEEWIRQAKKIINAYETLKKRVRETR